MKKLLTITIYTITILAMDAILQTHYEYVNDCDCHINWINFKYYKNK